MSQNFMKQTTKHKIDSYFKAYKPDKIVSRTVWILVGIRLRKTFGSGIT